MFRQRLLAPATAIALSAGLAIVLALSLGGTSATAQDSCAQDTDQFLVSTPAQLNDAIDCFNTIPYDTDLPGFEIVLLNDIDVESFTGESLLTPIFHSASLELLIDGSGFNDLPGAGYTIRRGTTAPNGPASILQMAPGNTADLVVVSTEFEVGSSETAAIRNDSDGKVNLIGVAITSGATTTATGLFAAPDAGSTSVSKSFIEGVRYGIEIQDGRGFAISETTIVSTNADVRLVNAGLGGIDNSTFAGPTGIELTESSADLNNSTILGDGARLLGAGPSFVVARSSIVGSCSAPVLPPDHNDLSVDQGIVNLSSNVGGCFNPADFMDYTFADHGCNNPTPAGCPPTAALRPFSDGIGAGDCSGIFQDQRGEPRSPQGPGCEAGAHEFPANASCPALTTTFAVATAAEFNQAVECFNTNDLGPDASANFTIELTSDIVLDSVSEAAVLTEFSSPYYETLDIQGSGFTISRGDAAATPLPVLSIQAVQPLFVNVDNLGIDLGQSDTVGLQMFGAPDSDVSNEWFNFEGDLLAITASPGSAATGMYFDEHVSDVAITNSLIDGTLVGIDSDSADAFIRSSTVRASNVAVRLGGSGFASVAFSTLDAPVGLIPNTELTFLGFSTVTGDAASARPDGLGTVWSYSSIANSCNGDILDQDGANVGGCFVPGQTMDTELADNGCVEATPAGCPMTIALTPGAAARGAATCGVTENGEILVDGRGFPRTPLGPGCDSGAFEAPGIVQDDINNDGTVDTYDVLALLDYLAGDTNTVLLDAADTNEDGEVRLDDALALAQQLAN